MPQILVAAFRAPDRVRSLKEGDWNQIIEVGRKQQLLGQLAALLDREQLLNRSSVPSGVLRHLELAKLTASRRSEAAAWEVSAARRAIAPSIPIVLLKGCAYAACDDHAATGRLFSDIDLLVHREHLSVVEGSLVSVGWKPSQVNQYDLAYYQNWMHEIPPLEHVRRHTVIDLHHAINPPISRYFIRPEKLFAATVEIACGVFVLAPTDRIIHCALHLLQEGEPNKLLRDLYDLHLLIRQHHGTDPDLRQISHRSDELNVSNLVFTAVGAAQSIFEPNLNSRPKITWMQSAITRAALEYSGSVSAIGHLARATLVAYSHRIKMPMRILVPHLIRKSIKRVSDNS